MRRREALLGLALCWRPALATREELQAAILLYTGGITPKPGGVQIDIAPLVENGNAVPVTLRAASPMLPDDHVQALALFNELNPQRDVVRFALTPANGRAEVSTRIRLATSQQLVALAKLSDGSWRSQAVDVVVTLAACVE
ncbi:thiosulfate oxidation carrier protein SoxY [Pelomonas sp. KK5]|uniref:thiosulfate oxidation carrier protein SoxY n=1 Tax=Pelomonas sp. KK5 TaxID=1855730 RepID=UPI00117C3CF3|nr:thiosulfate oxidation carrier protein SoxY [Pelomonas sp. KK5]